jgi:hypothetical protein
MRAIIESDGVSLVGHLSRVEALQSFSQANKSIFDEPARPLQRAVSRRRSAGMNKE